MKEKVKNKRILSDIRFVVFISVLCTLLWGTAFPAIKIGYSLFSIDSADIPSQLVFAGARFFLAGIIVLTIGLFTTSDRKKLILRKKDIAPVALLGFFQTFCQYLLLYIGIVHITGTRSAILTSVSTFGSVLLSAVIFKDDKLTLPKAAGCLVGILGIIFMNREGGMFSGFSLIGDGLVILSNLCGAAGNVISKKISPSRHPVQISGWQLITGSSALIAVGIFTGGRLDLSDTKGVLILLYLAAMAGVAFMLWTMLIFHNPVSRVAVFSLLIPVFGTMWSGLFLGESIFTMENIISLLLVCTGIFLVNFTFRFRKRKSYEN